MIKLILILLPEECEVEWINISVPGGTVINSGQVN